MPDREPKTFHRESISVEALIETIQRVANVPVEPVNTVDAEERLVTEPNLHRPGLALAGYTDLFTYQRIQILGNTENQYLKHLEAKDQVRAFSNLLQFPIPCIILAGSNTLASELIAQATEVGVPIYRSELPSTQLMARLSDFLDDQFARLYEAEDRLIDEGA